MERERLFKRYFPSGRLTTIKRSPLEDVKSDWEKRYPRLETDLFSVEHPDGKTTEVIALRNPKENFFIAELIDKDMLEPQGMGGLELEEDRNILSVAHTFTEKWARRKGLGTRRLQIMNAIGRMYFEDKPLHSDIEVAVSWEEKQVWRKLMKLGHATKIPHRFVFR